MMIIQSVKHGKPYVIPFKPGTTGSYGYVLVNSRFKDELSNGQLASSMLHAVMRFSWQSQDQDVAPVLNVGLAMPGWMFVRGEAADNSWLDIYLGKPINGTIPVYQEHLTAFTLAPGQRFTLAFTLQGNGREKYSAFHYREDGHLVCYLLDTLLVVPENKPLFKANSVLPQKLAEIL